MNDHSCTSVDANLIVTCVGIQRRQSGLKSGGQANLREILIFQAISQEIDFSRQVFEKFRFFRQIFKKFRFFQEI